MSEYIPVRSSTACASASEKDASTAAKQHAATGEQELKVTQ